MLKDFKELWGIPLDEIKRQGKKYKIYSVIVYALDIILILLCGIFMFKRGSSFNTCIFATVCVTILSFLVLNIVINPEKWRAYLFYKKYKSYDVITMSLYLHEDNMKSILYCSNYKRKKSKSTVSDYKEMMISACCEDSVYAKRLGKLLSKFTVNDEGMSEVKTYMLKKGKNFYLIGFCEEVTETQESE